MSNQEIIDNAPEGATHISEDYGLIYLRADPDEYVSSHNNFRWGANDVRTELLHFHTVRSLADIKRILELEKVIEKAASAVSQAFPCLVSCDNVLIVTVPAYNKIAAEFNAIKEPKP